VVCTGTNTISCGYNDQHNHWSYYLCSEEEMKIELENYRENEDGSADFNVYMDEAAKEFLLRYALIACITDAIETGKEATPTKETE
jgi:hypothetical protein